MKILIVFIFSITLIGCRNKEQKTIFDSLKGKADVTIYLSDYAIDSVPSAIGVLKGVERLYIAGMKKQTITVYPPLSALGEENMDSSRKQLPDEITSLTTLKTLELVNLNLGTLPEGLIKLKNLDTLNLFMNKLRISEELEKLKGMKQLKYLGLLGNAITQQDLLELTKFLPNTTINPAIR